MSYTAEEYSEWKLAMLDAGFKETTSGSFYRWNQSELRMQYVFLYDGFGGHFIARMDHWDSEPVYGAPACLAAAELLNWGRG